MSKIRGVEGLGLFRVIGQPNLNLIVDRAKADRFGINVSDIQDANRNRSGRQSCSQVLKGEERYDLVVRYQPQYRSTIEQIGTFVCWRRHGKRVPGPLCNIAMKDGASEVYREGTRAM
jgi:cobalt-zinc-cadmium resistance protein CzcA